MRAQVQSQVFIYILVVLVVGLLFLFGYRAVNGFLKQSCDVNEVSFLQNLQQLAVEGKGYRSSETVHLRSFCSYTELCLVDSLALQNGTRVTTSQAGGHHLLMDSINASVLRNVFLVKNTGVMNVRELYIDGLVVDGTVVCINTTASEFTFRMVGTGKGTRVEV